MFETAVWRERTCADVVDDHLAELRKSGLSDETIAAMGARSLTMAELQTVLGYSPNGTRSALALPYPGLNFARYKLFPPARGTDGHSIRYLQAKDSGVHLYVLPAARCVLPDSSVPIYYTEGEKKAAKAAQDGFPCIGLGGLWNWLETGTVSGIAELDAIAHVNREEIIVPDSDVWTRPDLLRAVYALGKELEARGARVNVLVLPSPDGVKVGVDDFLVANGADAFRARSRIPLKHAAFTKQREWYSTWKASRTPAVADAATGQGTALTLSNPEPWPEAVHGAELLDAIAQVCACYVVLPDGAAVAAALWTLHTYLIDVLHVSPILALTSPQKRCGKSTLLDVLRALVRRALGASNISAAAVFRVVETMAPTLLIDEADTFLAEREELRGILNAGHTRSTAQVVRTVGDGHEPRAFRTFCPKAIAAIGELPGTIEDRSIIIRMHRRAPDEHVARLRRDRIESELEPLRRRAARWAADNASTVREADPKVPSELDNNDRAADNWRPLLAIADLAGGDWPTRAQKAAKLLSGAGATEDSDIRVQLLADVRDIFGADEHVSTETLLSKLIAMPERPWSEWRHGKYLTPRGLSRLLKPFDIASKTVRLGASETAKGYARADFAHAFAHYLAAENVTASQPVPALGKLDVLNPSQGAGCDGLKSVTSSYSDKRCDVVTDGREVIEL